MNPGVKNYLIFSSAIAFGVAILLNFVFFEAFKSSLLYGFPISLMGSEGIGSFIIRIINTLITGLFFTPAVYLGIQWLQTRGR